MKPRVYKVKKEYNTKNKIIEYLKTTDKFEQKGKEIKSEIKGVSFTLFREIHPKNTPSRIAELENFFKVTPKFSEVAKQYNTIILVKTSRSFYLLPDGFAYHTVEKICEPDFGLNFAERTVQEDGISLRGVTYIQRNKIREVTQYKNDQNDFSSASESYFSISAKPQNEEIFGNNLDCGMAISFSKNFILNSEEGRQDFFKLFNEIDIAIYDNKSISSFPRFLQLQKDDENTKALDTLLLEKLNNEKSASNISIGFNRIQMAGNSIEIVDAISRLYVYITHDKGNKEEIGFNGENLKEFIKKNSKKIKNLDNLRLAIVDSDGNELKNDLLKKFLFCQIETDSVGSPKIFVLDEGRWGYFNERFYSLLDNQMKEINNIVELDNEFDDPYPIIKDHLMGEDAYIENILNKNKHYYKMHKRFISVGGVSVEIADIYDAKKEELLTIKRKVKTSTAMYSFDQSILGIRALENPVELEIRKYLEKERNDHEKLPSEIVDEIMKCKKQRILWLVTDDPHYVYKDIKDKTFKIGNLKSVLLKLKIIDWYSYLRENDYDIKLYFALDSPIEKMLVQEELETVSI